MPADFGGLESLRPGLGSYCIAQAWGSGPESPPELTRRLGSVPTDEGGRRGWATSVLYLAGICSAPQVSCDPLRPAPSAPGHTGETEAPEVRPLVPGRSAAARRLRRAA